MVLKTITFILLSFFLSVQCVSAQRVSQYLNQVIKYQQEEDNPPRSIHISLNSSSIRLQHIRGSRVMVTGQVVLHMNSIFFLESLIDKGRYDLYLSPDGGNGLRLEDKTRRPIILQNEHCKEEVSYIVYIPETIETVVFENSNTGETTVVAIEERISRTLAIRHSVKEEAPAASAPQVQVKDNN